MEERLSLSNGLLQAIKETFEIKEQDIRTYSPLALAYIGDGVYDLVIRTVVVERANQAAAKLHRTAVQYVKAEAQAKIVDAILEDLTEEEADVYKRGRNANSHTVAKNASRADYRKATGFEALVGYLYLTKRMDRVLELISIGLKKTEMKI